MRIFISHPSHFMTDCEPHGDGLLAYEYIHRLGLRGHELHVAVPAMRLERPVLENIHLYPVASWMHMSTSALSFAYRVEYAIRVRALLRSLQRKFRFDLIHQLNPVVRGVSALLGGCGLPIVLGPLPAPSIFPVRETMGQRLNRLVLHAQIRSSAMVLVPNMASLPLIPEEEESRSKVRELHFGVDTAVFRPVPPAVRGPQNVLFLANLVEKKGALFLLEAFEAIASKHPDCVLRFAGSGEQEQALKERAARSPAGRQIEFLGRVARENVAEVMNTATVYCLPSSVEAFGMTALEAMACGKPVIGTQVGGLALLVKATSPAVPSGDRNALASALDTLLSSPELCARLGEENRQIAVSEYDWNRVIDRLEGYYQELLPVRADARMNGAEIAAKV